MSRFDVIPVLQGEGLEASFQTASSRTENKLRANRTEGKSLDFGHHFCL